MTNQQKVLKLYPNAICKHMMSVIHGSRYYIHVPVEPNAITMRMHKTEDLAWDWAYRNYCSDQVDINLSDIANF